MALPEFDYFRPDSISEAVTLLRDYGGSAKVLAGGQSLLPILSMRLTQPEALVDIGALKELQGIVVEGRTIRIGALTKHREIEHSLILADGCPVLPAAARVIGHSHIRNRGTIGGSVAHADPAAEYPVALLALNAAIELTGSERSRVVPATGFFVGPLTTVVRSDELVTAVRVPLIGREVGWSFNELVLRSGDFSIVCVAALLTVNGRRIATVQLAIGGAGPVVSRLKRTEEALLGKPLAPDTWKSAGEIAGGEIDAVEDAAATAEYRRVATSVQVEEALHSAVARLQD